MPIDFKNSKSICYIGFSHLIGFFSVIMIVSLTYKVHLFCFFILFLSDDLYYMLETLDFAFHIGSTSTFLYFDLYLNTAYADTMFISLFIH